MRSVDTPLPRFVLYQMPTGQTVNPELSAGLLAAQQRLMALRQALPSRPLHTMPPWFVPADPEPNWPMVNAQMELDLRRKLICNKPVPKAALPFFSQDTQADVIENTLKVAKIDSLDTVAVYPSLLLAMLEKEQSAAGRVYLLLRHLDVTGRGWLLTEDIREHLTQQGSPLKVMGWRRLRQVFHQGEGVFWERDTKGRLWLRGALRIALELDCDRLKGKRIELPVKHLLGGIGEVRAHFYASFHSGRSTDNPISRDTLEKITGVSPRTQREYDRVANVKRQQNIAIGPKETKTTAEDQYWQRGGAVFTFVDGHGKQGPKNRQYLAWRLPNSYQAPHRQCSKGRQKKINQKLVRLVKNGVQATDQLEVDKLFWADGAAAGKACSRDREKDAYWQQGKAQRSPSVLWHVLGGEAKYL